MEARSAANGRFYLNVGCGVRFSREWNNLDLNGPAPVIAHDVRHALPYTAGTFDAAYSSHVMEHLTPEQGRFFIGEQVRVLKPGGICRIVVPDLERNCRDYLEQLQRAEVNPSASQLRDYQWSVFQLIDQLVRDQFGGEMIKALREKNFNPEYIRSRFGDEFAGFAMGLPPRTEAAPSSTRGSLFQAWKNWARRHFRGDARSTGEVHRWMYDRLSLRLLMTQLGLIDFKILSHSDSGIPDWNVYHLDQSQNGTGPRKPDSLYVEGKKP